jgi:protein tyrosine phosphatase
MISQCSTAHLYFPAEVGQTWHMEAEPGHDAPDIEVKLLASRSHDNAQCVQSTVSIRPVVSASANTEPIVFNHLLYGAWPDHGVPAPEERASLLDFARLVDRTNRDVAAVPTPHRDGLDPDPPIMVGCSAGIGRTGSFIALCSLLRTNGFLPPPPHNAAATVDEPHPPLPASPLGPLPKELADDPVALEVDSLREQRPGMVQRPEQIVLVYEALALAFVQRGT